MTLGTEMSTVFKKEILTNWYISNNSPNEFNNWLYKNIHSVQYLKWSDVCKKALLYWKGLPFEGNFPYRCKGYMCMYVVLVIVGLKTVIGELPPASSSLAANICRRITGRLTNAISKVTVLRNAGSILLAMDINRKITLVFML